MNKPSATPMDPQKDPANTPAAAPKAYSYVRFSTLDQAGGDSLRRQTERAKAYAEAHGLELDGSTYRDLGVSGFRGKNVQVGRLGEFLGAVEAGDIQPGSMLIIESFDRISRDTAGRGQHLVLGIIYSGITIVTLIGGTPRVYSAEILDSPGGQLLPFEILLTLLRAHEESSAKADRVRAGKAAQRRRVAAGEGRFTKHCPNWMEHVEGNTFALVPERAEIVRRIFWEYLEGWGWVKIARRLNGDGVPTFPNGKRTAAVWHPTYIGRVLKNPAAVGTLVMHETEHERGKGTRIEKDRTEVEGYYPATISEEAWQDVQALLAKGSAKAPARGRHAGKAVTNLFGGLIRCGSCGATVTKANKGRYHYLVCTRAKKGGGCVYRSVRYEVVEKAFLRDAGRILGQAPSGNAGVDAGVQGIEDAIDATKDAIERVLRAIEAGGEGLALTRRLRELEGQLADLEAEQDEALREAGAISGPAVERRLRELGEMLSTEPLDRTRANTLMRQVFSGVVLGEHEAWFRFRHGGEGREPVLFRFPTATG